MMQRRQNFNEKEMEFPNWVELLHCLKFLHEACFDIIVSAYVPRRVCCDITATPWIQKSQCERDKSMSPGIPVCLSVLLMKTLIKQVLNKD